MTQLQVNTWVVELYRHLRPFIRTDLIQSVGFSNPQAGAILNYFDPAREEYLDHVDRWQKFLCRGVCVSQLPLEDAIASQPDGWYETKRLSAWEVRAVQQVAKLLYKAHGIPARETNWEEVKNRLSRPLPITLKDDEVAGIRQCLSGIKPVDLNEAKGRFGPGATAEGFDAFEKWVRKGQIPDVPANLFRANPRDTWVPSGLNGFRVTKMAEVPKSIKCNRIVSSEPAMSMYCQLAINDNLVRQIHYAFPGHVSLDDQEKHNRLLLRPGMATLDLSDASDHVSVALVRDVLPQLWPVLAKVRSEYSCTPDGYIIPLGTFAPMGAGNCFSTMTTVILGIIAYAFESFGYSYMRESWSVYGDDIIIPIWIADYVIDLLTRAGLVINQAKSCTSGLYVESCGLELFRGCDVTPGYIRDPLQDTAAEKIENILSKLQDQFPSTAGEIFTLASPVRGMRWNKNLQEGELLVRTSSARAKLRRLDGWAGLNRWFAVGSMQELNEDNTSAARRSGLACEVWTKEAWRFKPALNYPCLLGMSGSHAPAFTQGKPARHTKRARMSSRTSESRSSQKGP